MEPRRYVRRVFDVEAVQITEDNIDKVARWINPNFRVLGDDNDQWIMVPYKDSKGRPQKAMATVGNWVTRNSDGTYKRYSDKGFHATFEKSD